MTPARKGRIILLNGPSSSGKSNIGRALLPCLPDPWFLVPVDAIGAMRSTVHTRVLDDTEVGQMLSRTRVGYHRAVAALASAGNDVIMDYRPVGLARSQTTVYAHGEFDIAVDTTTTGPDACAMAIVNALGAVPSPKAFDRLRRRDT